MHGLMRLAVAMVVVFGLAVPAGAEVRLASIFTDNLVLQREQPVPVWGTAKPGETVTVSFARQTVIATADARGQWHVTLDALKASAKPQSLFVTGSADSRKLEIGNVLVGEVWLCSGQSNMEFPFVAVRNSPAEIGAADYPLIRMFTVVRNPASAPLTECDGSWVVCTPQSAPAFSAVGLCFAQNLFKALKVPVGMIHSSWGGTPAEAWTPLPALKALPLFTAQAEAFEGTILKYLASKREFDQRRTVETNAFNAKRADWYKTLDATDQGLRESWFAPAFAPKDWKTITAPVVMGANPQGYYVGSLWHRKTVTIPAAWIGKDLELHVGAVDEVDDTYVNGTHVGRTWFEVPNYWLVQRVYAVPAAAVTATTLTVTVRVLNLFGDVGLFGPANAMKLVLKGAAKNEKGVSLAGDWAYAPGLPIDPKTIPQAALTPLPGTGAGDPASLFNGMINPLVPYALRGAIWYQGEANAGNPVGYRELLPGMIHAWRAAWGGERFAFGIVQLANFMGVQEAPVEKGSWAELREAQTLTAKTLPNTGLAVAIDIGDANDIHPRNKQEVGRRLALAMLAKAYGRKVEYAGPTYEAMQVKAGKAVLTFAHAKGLRAKVEGAVEVGRSATPAKPAKSAAAAKGGEVGTSPRVTGFAIAGQDKVFHVAQARIEGSTVVVWSEAVPKPVAVRYAWANNPVCNLYNAAGLPACPFRTDAWKPEEFSVAAEKVAP